MSEPDILPGIPPVEFPLFPQIVDRLGLTDTERTVALQLHEQAMR